MGYRKIHNPEGHEDLFLYLQSWGLREFHNEEPYYEWQRSLLSQEELKTLHWLIDHRKGGEHEESDIKFYDVLASPDLVPVVYSQRFQYFLTIGSAVRTRIPPAKHVLDFGCGVGILTIFFAQLYPDIEFVGLDRSSRSIALAKVEAEKRKIRNIRFEVSRMPQHPIPEKYDLILSTQAVFQAERERGLPSRDWKTFHRVIDLPRQEQLELKTGLKGRLNLLVSALRPTGRMIFFEKTWNLGRRILFQRALEARGLRPVSAPVYFQYRCLDEEVIDGPLFEVARLIQEDCAAWNEEPYRTPGESLYRCRGVPAKRMVRELDLDEMVQSISGIHSGMGSWTFRFGIWKQVFVWGFLENFSGLKGLVIGGKEEQDLLFSLVDTLPQLKEPDFEQLISDFWEHVPYGSDEGLAPGYENHSFSAQFLYESLPSKHLLQQSTLQDGEGGETHIERGNTISFTYLYWANNFDQRQLIIIDPERAHVLQAHYNESLDQPQRLLIRFPT